MHHTPRLRVGLWVSVGLFAARAAMAANPPALTNASAQELGAARPLDAIQKYAAPADNVLLDLRAGLRKLQKLCSTPSSKGASPDPAASSAALAMDPPWAQASVPLARSRALTAATFDKFERDSRMNDVPVCRMAPSWLPVCNGYKQDKQLLEAATSTANKLFDEAAQRLDLYAQYAELEASKCTSRGFTQRLWRTEETYLWPLVTGAPDFFGSMLQVK